jgi:hypothetical protein
MLTVSGRNGARIRKSAAISPCQRAFQRLANRAMNQKANHARTLSIVENAL